MLHVKTSRLPPAHVWPVRAACPLYSGVIVSLGTKNSVSKEAADFLVMCADASREELENFQTLPLVLDNVQFHTRQRRESASSA